MMISRSSTSLARRWSSATVPDHKYQLSDELEHRITMMETSLTRFGMILDSVQADVMQVNKGTKELSLEVEGIRQKSTVHDDSLHLLNRGQVDIRASLDVGFKSISDQLSAITKQGKLEQILSEVINLPECIDTNIRKRNDELSKCLSGDLQAITCSIDSLSQKNMALAILPPKVTGADSSLQESILRREAEPRKVSKQAPLVPMIETGSWTTVKAQKMNFSNRSEISCKNMKQRRASPGVKNRAQKSVIEVDESDEDFSCFIVKKELDSHVMDEVNVETARILRLARRRKRKQNSKRSVPSYQRK